ncbi:MAG TPA: 2-dehydro-3-deoxy-6-phosphogalactonate aldolase [Aestuariivirgaceae bacterium]|nr:2-dehydro-3-deoxy-6-phosphogalactonate aldolase [Aestuariivirgaceae bacterium]
MTSPPASLRSILGQAPVIAILRGLAPEEAADIAMALLAAGIRLIEVPLNGARAAEAIARLTAEDAPTASIGAGTVVDWRDVAALPGLGCRYIVTPNLDPEVIAAAIDHGLESIIGVATPSEAFKALACGATMLKMVPAEQMSPAVLKAWRAVLPPGTALIPVGGVTPETAPSWLDAGAAGVALGSALYSPSRQPRLAADALVGCSRLIAGRIGPG